METLEITKDSKTVTVFARNKDVCAYICVFFEGPDEKVRPDQLNVRCKLDDSQLRFTQGFEGCYFLRSFQCKKDFVAT